MTKERDPETGAPMCRCHLAGTYTNDLPYIIHPEIPRFPYWYVYGDEDMRALDETNWDAVAEDLLSIGVTEIWPLSEIPADLEMVDVPAFVADAYGECRGQLHVRPGTEAAEMVADLARSLADYPILDEDAYSEREWNAWQEWFPRDGLSDLFRDRPTVEDWCDLDDVRKALPVFADPRARALIAQRFAGITESEIVDGFYESDLAEIAQEGMGYWEGFSGSFDEAGAVAALTAHIVAVVAWHVAADLAAWPTNRDQIALAV